MRASLKKHATYSADGDAVVRSGHNPTLLMPELCSHSCFLTQCASSLTRHADAPCSDVWTLACSVAVLVATTVYHA